MNVRAVYITQEEFESYLATGRLYSGFVIGLGYASVEAKMMQPLNMNGSKYYYINSAAKYEPSSFNIVQLQCLDISPEMVELSRLAAVTGTYEPYYVCKGESLWEIANRLGVTVDELTQWNGMHPTDTIHPGQQLMVDVYRVRTRGKVSTADGSSKGAGSSVEVLDISFSAVSATIASKLAMENYKYLSQLASSNKFLGMRNGVLTVMDDGFLSTSRMAATRGADKSAFLSKVNKLGWLSKIGTGLSLLSTGISFANLVNAETTEEKWEYGADSVAGVVGFFGPIGAFLSFNYFLGKAQYPTIINEHIERGERLSRGDYSMWFAPGRPIR